MIKFSYKCTGCEICKYVCNKSAIYFEIAENGYSYPKIDKTKCINCGICENSCAVLATPLYKKSSQTFTFKSFDKNTLINTSSGGFATTITKISLSKGYKVFGVVWDMAHKEAIHEEVTLENICYASKSKYVKAKTNNYFEKIASYLEAGFKVMNIGLPCENFALRAAFKKYENNICFVDLFCGGFVNSLIFEKYIQNIEEKSKNEVADIDFRCKDFGTEILCTKVVFKDGTSKYLNGKNNSYIPILGSNFVRPSCYNCKMGYLESQSDIKIGDYFGKKSRENGVTVVLKYSSKDIVNEILQNIAKEGIVSNIEGENINDITRCRSKNSIEYNERLANESVAFFSSFKENKLLWETVKKHIFKKYTFKQKLYFYLPYSIKKMGRKNVKS